MKKTHDHDTHTPGDPEEIEHLPTTPRMRQYILGMLENDYGITRRQIRMKLNRDMLTLPIQHVDSQVRTEAIAHIYRQWHSARRQKGKDDTVSVARWLDDLEARQYTVWRIANDDTSRYASGFCASWQKNELTASDNWSMDATHNTGPDANALLYTIIVRHPVADRGIPVAYLFTNDTSAYPVTKWLENIAGLGASPKIITIDYDLGEVKAIQNCVGRRLPFNTVHGMYSVHGGTSWWTRLLNGAAKKTRQSESMSRCSEGFGVGARP